MQSSRACCGNLYSVTSKDLSLKKGACIGEVQRAISLWNLKMEIWLFQVSSRQKKVHSRVTLNKFKN